MQVLTAPFAVAADALSFFGSALLVGRIPVSEAAPAPGGPPVPALLREGLALVPASGTAGRVGVHHDRQLLRFIANALLVLFASRELHLSAGATGIALGIGSLGAVAGAALAPRVSRLIGLGRTETLGTVVFPAPLAAMAFATGPAWAKVAVLAGAELVSSTGVVAGVGGTLAAVWLLASPVRRIVTLDEA